MKEKIVVLMVFVIAILVGTSVLTSTVSANDDTYSYRTLCPGGGEGTAPFLGKWNKSDEFWSSIYNFAQCNCTDFVAYWLNTFLDQHSPSEPLFTNQYYGYDWGHAAHWKGAFESGTENRVPGFFSRYPVESFEQEEWKFRYDPQLYSGEYNPTMVIAWWKGTQSNKYGHVARTLKVHSDGRTVTVAEYNGRGDHRYGERTLKEGDHSYPDGFLYLVTDSYLECDLMGNVCNEAADDGNPGGSGGNPSLPDFTITQLQLQTPWGTEANTFGTNEAITQKITIKNIGTVDASEGVEMRLYLSDGYAKDKSSEWKLLNRAVIDKEELQAGETQEETEETRVWEDNISPGIYNIVACIDRVNDHDNGNGNIEEQNEKNNCSDEAVFEIVEGMHNIPDTDLIIFKINLNVNNPVLPGGNLGGSMTIKNIGSQKLTTDFRSSYEIKGPGTNNTWKRIADDGSSADELAPGKEQSERMDEKVPAPSVIGAYTLRGCADYQGIVVESNEANNCLETPFEIKAGQPDFIIIATGLKEGTSIKSGTRVHPYCIVQNIGTGNSPREMRLAYYINQNEYRDDDNVSANEMCIGCQQKEEVNNDNIKLGDKGTRTLRCCADYQGVVAESNESNNCLTVEFKVTKK